MPADATPMMPRLVGLFLGMQAIGFAGTWLHTRGADVERVLRIRRKFLVFFGITTSVFLSIYLRYPFILLAALVVSVGLLEVGRLSSLNRRAGAVALPAYCIIGIGFFLFALQSSITIMLSVYAIIVALDGFSQVSGQLFGRTPLAPTISPSKTLEGFLGGAAASALAYAALARFDLYARNAAALCVILMAGLAGDLLASGYKRAADVKDFGDFIPYHGGVLDRFDSFMMAGFAYYVVSLINVTL